MRHVLYTSHINGDSNTLRQQFIELEGDLVEEIASRHELTADDLRNDPHTTINEWGVFFNCPECVESWVFI